MIVSCDLAAAHCELLTMGQRRVTADPLSTRAATGSRNFLYPACALLQRLGSVRVADIADAGTATVVGDRLGGWFWLPPLRLWADTAGSWPRHRTGLSGPG